MSEAAVQGGWLARLKSGLARSSGKLGDGITGIFTKRRLDDAALEELEELLISADLGVATAAKLTGVLAREKFDKEVAPEEVRAAYQKEMAAMTARLEEESLRRGIDYRVLNTAEPYIEAIEAWLGLRGKVSAQRR